MNPIPQDELRLRMLISEISASATRQALQELGMISATMKRSEAYKRASRRSVDAAIRLGHLKTTVKGREVLIDRNDFEKWRPLNIYIQ